MNAILKFFLIHAMVLVGIHAHAQMPYAKGLASTIMKQYKDSMVVKKFASHLQQDKEIPAGMTAQQAALERPATWGYEIGVVLIAFEKLFEYENDSVYRDYAKHIVDHFIQPDGTIRTYEITDFNSDFIPPARILLYLLEQTGDLKYQKAAQTIRNQIAWQPRNQAGGFWHKLKYPSQMWLDGLYMVQPFYAAFANKFNQPDVYNDIVHQFEVMYQHAKDPKTGLLYHGWDESRLQRWANPANGLSPEFWSRSMGWYMMALVDVLDYLPSTHVGRKVLIQQLNELTQSLVHFQDQQTGVWWQITNKGGKDKNYLESSSTAMFVYAIAKGIRLGYLSNNLNATLKKAYAGMEQQFIRKDDKGQYHYIQAVSGAGLGGTPYRDGTYDYYVNEPKRDDDLKAIGPFIQACIEMDRLKK